MNNKSGKHSSRLENIDALRGFSLLGIIIVNAASINSPAWMDTFEFAFHKDYWDQITANFLLNFFVAKFYPIFGFLFGTSCYLFCQKFGKDAWSYWSKRTIILSLFGLFQILFIWWGDILLVYAILGLAIYFLRKKSSNILILTTLLLTIANSLLPQLIYVREDTFDLIYAHGSYAQIFSQRINDYLMVYWDGFLFPTSLPDWSSYFTYYAGLLSFMIWGFLAGRHSFFNLQKNTYLYFTLTTSLLAFLGLDFLYSVSIISLFCYFWTFNKAKNILKFFIPLGKNSLSFYIGSNLILSLIHYSYGLGLYGVFGPSLELLLGIFIYITGVTFFNAFPKQGPCEKLLRFFVYSGKQLRTVENLKI